MKQYICTHCLSTFNSDFKPSECLICVCSNHSYKLIRTIVYEAYLGNPSYSINEIEEKLK